MGSSQSKQPQGKITSPSQEKHNSADSKTPLASHADGFSAPRSPSPGQYGTIVSCQSPENHGQGPAEDRIEVDEQEGHSDVTRPPPPPRLRRLSELIDPHELTVDSHVRSPSGNLLAVEQFLVHPDRPRSIRERQEHIRGRVRAASRLGQESQAPGNGNPEPQTGGDKKSDRQCKFLLCGCFGRS